MEFYQSVLQFDIEDLSLLDDQERLELGKKLTQMLKKLNSDKEPIDFRQKSLDKSYENYLKWCKKPGLPKYHTLGYTKMSRTTFDVLMDSSSVKYTGYAVDFLTAINNDIPEREKQWKEGVVF